MFETTCAYALWIMPFLSDTERPNELLDYAAVEMTPLSACVQPGHGSAYITLESKQPERRNIKEVSLLLTATCIFCHPWLYEMSHNPICVSWGVGGKHRNNIVSRNAEVTRGVLIMHKPCLWLKHAMNQHTPCGGMQLFSDWQVSEPLYDVVDY